jgi:hypothetical protein
MQEEPRKRKTFGRIVQDAPDLVLKRQRHAQ